MKQALTNLFLLFKNGKVMKILFMLFSLFFLLLIYIVNYYFPLFEDDFGYSFIILDSARVDSVWDILVSQYTHYFTWGGRSIVHCIAQYLLMIDIRIARILNTLALSLLFFLLYKIINKGKKMNLNLFILVNIILWLIFPEFTRISVWITGSANYVWGGLLIFMFIYPFYTLLLDKKSKDSLFKSVLFFVAGVIAGWTNENTVIGMIFLLSSWVIYLKYKKIRIPRWVLLGIVGVCIGCAIMILAPGNMARSIPLYSQSGLYELSRFDRFKWLFANLFNASKYIVLVSLLLYALFLFLFIKSNNNTTIKKSEILFVSGSFFLAGLVSLFSLLPVSFFPVRALMGVYLFFILAFGILYVNFSFRSIYIKTINVLVVLSLFICYLVFYVDFFKDVYNLSTESRKRELFIEEEQRKEGSKLMDLTVDRLDIIENSRYHDPLSKDENFWANGFYARYCGLKSIKVKFKKETDLIQ